MNSKVLISPLLIGSIAIGNITLVLVAAVSGASIPLIALQSATNNMIPEICIDQYGNLYKCP